MVTVRNAEYILHRTVDHGTRQTVEGGKKCLKHDFGNYVGESGATKTKFLLIFFASDDSFNIFVLVSQLAATVIFHLIVNIFPFSLIEIN